MLKSFRYRILPTYSQEELLNKHIGSARFVYNLALEAKKMAYSGRNIHLSRIDLQVQLKDLKNSCEWLKEINSQTLQVALMNLDTAYTRFFKGKSDFPKFKKKSSRQSFNIPQGISLKGNRLIIPKFQSGIKIVLHRDIKGTIRQATVSKTVTGKYFVSILCETGETNAVKPDIAVDSLVGVDLGLKTYLVTSNGLEIPNPKYLVKSHNKIKYLHSRYSRYKGKKTRRKLSILHERVTNQRKDFLQKLSTKLIRENQSIALENLHINGMVKNHCLAKSVSDAGWGIFVDMLNYKAEWYGKNILKIGRFEPSSKTCSHCGLINTALTLKDRSWACECGSTHDRDVNAAINIKNFALKNLSTERRLKNQNELPELLGVETSEAFIYVRQLTEQ